MTIKVNYWEYTYYYGGRNQSGWNWAHKVSTVTLVQKIFDWVWADLGLYILKIKDMGLPWWSSGKESALQYRGHGFDPWSGNKDPTCRGATKPARHNYWAPHLNEIACVPQTTEPMRSGVCAPQLERESLHTTTKSPRTTTKNITHASSKIPRAATKMQHRQKTIFLIK